MAKDLSNNALAPTLEEIQLAGTKGAIPYKGYVSGDFAAHKDLTPYRQWTVSHLPTGRLLITLLTEERARNLAVECARLYPVFQTLPFPDLTTIGATVLCALASLHVPFEYDGHELFGAEEEDYGDDEDEGVAPWNERERSQEQPDKG